MQKQTLPDALNAAGLVRLPGTMQFSGLGRSALYEAVKRKEFPAPVKLTPSGRAVGWRIADLQSWAAARCNKSAPGAA